MEQIDWQSAFNLLITLLGSVAGWFLRTLWAAAESLRKDLNVLNDKIRDGMSELERQIPNVYVRRDDFREAVGRIEITLERIEQKLDRKVDR